MDTPLVRVGIGVIVVKDGKFLLQKRTGSHGEGTWSLPGGHLEFGESFEDTAKREVKEETNLDIQNIQFAAVTNDIFKAENKHYVTVWILSEYSGGELKNMEPHKCTEQGWFTLDTLPEPLFPSWKQLFASDFITTIRSKLGASNNV